MGSLWVRVGWILFAVFLILQFAATHKLSEQTISATSKPPAIADFIDIASTAGLSASNVFGGKESSTYILESTGTGTAIFDYDNDGWPDIFLVNGTRLDGFDAKSAPTSHLYRNNHDGTFTDVTEKAGLVASGWGQGVCVGDYDNDGWDDLYVTYYGKNRLYHNLGGKFEEVAEKSGVAGDGKTWSTGCAFVDYDRDGQLDLAVANYANFDLAHASPPGKYPTCLWKGIAVFCGPRGLPGGRNILYRNLGKGRFQDMTLSSFTDVGIFSGVAYNVDGREQAGMGSTVADYDGDGNLDLFRTNFSDDTPTLYHNNGDGTFTDVTYPAGLGSSTRYLGWGTMFFDFDNDGWPDLLLVNGHVYPEVEDLKLGITYSEPKLLFHNKGDGKFSDISKTAGPGINTPAPARGLAIGDLWNDGRLSAVIVNRNGAPSLLVNRTTYPNHWIEIKTVGTDSNRGGIGARLVVKTATRTQIDEVRSGSSYISNNDMRVHFGLGTTKKIAYLEVRWPSGLVERYLNPRADSIVVVIEGSGQPVGRTMQKPAKKDGD